MIQIRFVAIIATCTAVATSVAQDLSSIVGLGGGRSIRSSSCNADWKGSNVDFRFIMPGKSLTLADFKGPGEIHRIWLTVLPSEPNYSRLMTIRIYWDGEKSPSVECPIGDFFGVGHGLDIPFDSLPVRASSDGKARSCVWVMPFRKSARITVSNEGTQATWGFYFAVDAENKAVKANTPYFHAMYRQEFPCKPGNYTIADIVGRGQYVGTVLSVRSTSSGWWGEGDDFFFIDGEKTPSLRGTGLEDYFGEAWGLRKTNGLYTGCSYFEGGYPGARATCYRWHIPDPVRFTKSLHVEIEHKGVAEGPDGKDLGNNNERADEYSSAAFWYQLEPHKPFASLPSGPDRLPFDYRRFVEAEDALPNWKASGGALAKVHENGLRGNAQVEWSGMSDGNELTIPFEVNATDEYQIMVLATRRWDGGSGQFTLDGVKIGDPVSFHSDGYDTHQELTLPFAKMSQGRHVLALRSTNGGWYGIDGFDVQPIRR